MKVGTFTKQPSERISKSIRYTEALDPGDSISMVTSCVVTPSSEFNDLSASPVLVSEDRVRIWTEAGVDGVAYKVTVTVQTANGEVFEDELVVKVKEI